MNDLERLFHFHPALAPRNDARSPSNRKELEALCADFLFGRASATKALFDPQDYVTARVQEARTKASQQLGLRPPACSTACKRGRLRHYTCALIRPDSC